MALIVSLPDVYVIIFQQNYGMCLIPFFEYKESVNTSN